MAIIRLEKFHLRKTLENLREWTSPDQMDIGIIDKDGKRTSLITNDYQGKNYSDLYISESMFPFEPEEKDSSVIELSIAKLNNNSFIVMNNDLLYVLCIKGKGYDLTPLKSIRNIVWKNCRDLSAITKFPLVTDIKIMFDNSTTKDLQAIKSLTEITSLELSNCPSLESLDGINDLANLKTIKLINCQHLRNIEAAGNLKKLNKLILDGCTKLGNISALLNCVSLKEVSIFNCPMIKDREG